jgi:hypothetical protein
VSRACGLSPKAITKGIKEVETGQVPPPARVRQLGAGRRKINEHDPSLIGALEFLIDPETRGDPESPLRWTCKITRALGRITTLVLLPLRPSVVGGNKRGCIFIQQRRIC